MISVGLLHSPSGGSARVWSKTSSEAPEGPSISDRHGRSNELRKGDRLSAEREVSCPPTGILDCPLSRLSHPRGKTHPRKRSAVARSSGSRRASGGEHRLKRTLVARDRSRNDAVSTQTATASDVIHRRTPAGSVALGERAPWLNDRPVRSQMASVSSSKRNSNSVVDWCVGGDVVVAASEVLDEGMAGGKDSS